MENIIGKKFGRLLVLRPIKATKKYAPRTYECECDCGNLAYPARSSLLQGFTSSCGCIKSESSIERATTIDKKFYIPIVLEYISSSKTFTEIGKEYGVTRERIRQIVRDFGENEAKFLKKSCMKFDNRDELKRKELKKVKDKNLRIFDFWKRVEVKEDFNECWNWTGDVFESGYGSVAMKFFGKTHHGAHRISWILAHGNPENYSVLHKCDNSRCCNPNHLYLGSDKDNARDRVLRNRSKYRSLSHEEKLFISSLKVESREQVIRLKEQYNVSAAAIRNHIDGKYEARFLNGNTARYIGKNR